MIERNRDWACVRIGLVVALVLCASFLAGMFSNFQSRLHDPLYGSEPLSNFVILAIDDKSLQDIGRWPWNRSVFAQVLPMLKTARVVGVDVVFSEPTTAEVDGALASAVREAGNVVLAGEYSEFEKQGNLVVSKATILPLPELRAAASAVGIINLATDPDGITRSANSNIQGDHRLFAEEVARRVAPVSAPKENRLLINMVGPKGSFETVSLTDVLHMRVESSSFTDKIVLIGSTAPDLHDDHLAPTSAGVPVPGVEIQANFVQMLLTRRFLSSQPAWSVLLAVFVACAALSVLLARWNSWIVAGLCVLFLVGYLVAIIQFFERGVLLDMVFLPFAVFFTYGANVVALYVVERQEKRQAIEAFTKYVAPEVVAELFKHPEKLKLGGERRNITIFFSDIRGFTTLSEQLSPEQLVHVLNEYLTAMTDIIMESRGVVDKYIGDAIMAFWGAPLEQKDHAVRACTASLAMIDKLKELQIKWKKEGVPLLDIGIGLNTGDAVIGNMGSAMRFNYTCMGDTINLASRLEGINKEYGTHIIVSESTKKNLPKDFVFRELDFVRVKGKKEPITIYELVGKGKVSESTEKIIHLFASGLKKYRMTKFKEAHIDFEKAAGLGDTTSKLYVERCEHFVKNHPGTPWDCVWVMKTK
ncbi:adenylate/guanylate cyclase domain-containing protein [Candidatus Woesearchaeota archaeon]|nr:adenylate/guanylate cyclase domain-containing protein [Candidatus Woesearchaeota archaeon]